MTYRDVVAVGASAGGVEALRAMVAGLPAGLPAAVLVVLHVPRESPSALPRILSRAGPLPARLAFDGEPLVAGRIYVAPADRHLLLLGDRVRLGRGPAENGHRPAVDPLFRSAARSAGARVIAVVLSGSRDDGAVGVEAVASRGGTVVIQEPGDALNGSMPRAAMSRVDPDHLAAAADLGPLLGDLTGKPVPDAGHDWSPASLLAEQAVATEGALWLALRALEEKSALGRRMADTRAGHGGRFTRMADDADHARVLIRDLLGRLGASTAAPQE